MFFRSGSLDEAGLFLRNIAALDRLGARHHGVWSALLFLLPLVGLHVVDLAARERRLVDAAAAAAPRRAGRRAMVYGIVTLYAGTADFIYFQF